MQAAAVADSSTQKQWALCVSTLQSERGLASGLERQKGSFLQRTVSASTQSRLMVPPAQAVTEPPAQSAKALCTPSAGPDFTIHVVGALC